MTSRNSKKRTSSEQENKLRGGYYTPEDVGAWLAAWAVRTSNDHVLEPSCGDGAILKAAARRLLALGASASEIKCQLRGVEFDPVEAAAARKDLSAVLGCDVDNVVSNDDFFSWQASEGPRFDAIVGNPPFIRYQAFPEPHRARAMALMKAKGLSPNRLTNIWVPFVVGSISLLRKGGRFALVLPAELLQVTYAAQLRSFLTSYFETIDIVSCNELIFPNAEQEVVLVLANGRTDRAGSASRVSISEAHSREEITSTLPHELLKRAEYKFVSHDTEKWLKYFLSAEQISLMRELRSSPTIAPLALHASVDVGVVTGNNEFFVLSQDQVSRLDVPEHMVRLISRSAQLKGARVSSRDWMNLSDSGDRVYLLDLKSSKSKAMSNSLREYILHGEKNEVHLGYKCSIRNSWFAVPSIWAPDGFLLRQIHDFPKLVHNEAGATSTDTVHRVTYHSDPEAVVSNSYTWLFAASAEIEGRSYGGGVLELEPTEAERLLMPAKPNGAMPIAEVDTLVRAGRLEEVLAFNAKAVLRDHLGLSLRESEMLRDIWMKMKHRRMGRGKKRKTIAQPPY